MAKQKKEIALELYNGGYEVESISKILKCPIATVNRWIADKKNKVVSKVKTTFLTDIRYQFIKDIPDLIKGLTLAGYAKDEIALKLNITEKELDSLIENNDDIFKAFNYASMRVNAIVVESLLNAILPGKKIETHKYFNFIKDENGNITNIDSAESYIGKIVEKDDRGDVAGLIKWLEVKIPSMWNIKDKNDADRLGNYGVADLGSDKSVEQWEEDASDHQSDLKEKIKEEMKAEDD